MATDIGPKIGIKGEAAFKRELQSINTQLKTTKAEMEKVSASFDDGDKSSQRYVEQLVVMHRQLGQIKKQQDLARNALNNAAKTYGENSVQAEKWRLTIAKSEAEQSKLERTIRKTQSAIVQNNAAVENNADKLNDTAAACELCTAAVAAFAGTALRSVKDALLDCVQAAIEFESAITGVYKTVDGTDEQLAGIAADIKNIATEIPTSTTELAAVAEAAGQLGIATDDVVDFSRTMVMLGTTTNMQAEEAATALARFANVAGTSADDYDRLGAVIVALGNNLATTESEITAMGQRLSSAGTLAGLTESEIMALAAAMSSVGIEAEAGGTAMTQTLSAISKAVDKGGEDLAAFADIAGMSSDEFAAKWQNKPIEALQAFVKGLGDLDAAGGSSIMALEDLGLSGIRQSNMLRSLSLAADQMTGAVNIANTAWAENTALQDEANLRYGTTESKLQLLSNATTRLAAAYGSTLNPTVASFAEISANAENHLAKLIEDYPVLGDAVTVAGAAMTAFAVASVGATIAQCEKLVAVLNTLKAAALSNPMTAAAAAVAALGTAIVLLATNSEKAEKKYASLNKEIKEAQQDYLSSAEDMTKHAEGVLAVAAAYERLYSEQDGTTASAAALANKQQELLQLMPELAGYVDAETGALSGSWRAQVDAALAAEQRAAAMENLARVENSLAEVQGELAAAEAEQERLAKADGYAAANPYIRENAERCIELSGEIARLKQAEDELVAQQENANAELQSFGGAAEDTGDSVADIENKVSSLTGQLGDLAMAYDQAYNSAYEAISKQIGLFDEMDAKSSASISDMINALDSQVSYMERYADNLAAAVAKGVDEGMIAKLSDGTEESAKYLAALANATDEQIAKINESFRKTEDGKKVLAGAIAEAQTGAADIVEAVKNGLAELPGEMDMTPEAKQSAINTIQGYLDGIDGRTGELYAKMRTVAKGALDSWKGALDEHSPARKFEKSGHNSVAGYLLGWEKDAQKLNAVMQNSGQTAIAGFGKGITAGNASVLNAIRKEMSAAWKAAQAGFGTTKSFSDLQKALKNTYTVGLVDEETYYKKLKALRDQYLKPDSGEWESISLDIYSQEQKKLEESSKSFLAEYKSVMQEAADVTKEALSDIQGRYEDVVKAQDGMRDKLAGYGSLYDTIKLNFSDGSSGEYYKLADWEKQIDVLHEYQRVLNGLKDRGLSQGLMDNVLGMGVDEAVRYGKELLGQSDEQWSEYNRQWNEKQKLAAQIADEYYKSELDSLQNEYVEELQSGLDSLKGISTAAGGDVVDGLISGMQDKNGDLRRQMQEIADTIEQELRKSLDMHSPSKRLENLAELAGEGLPKGFAPKLEEFRQMIDNAVPGDLTVNYAQQGGYQRDSSMLDALSTLFGGAAPSGDLTLVLRVDGLDFARAQLPNFRQAAAENPIAEVDF